MNLSHSAAGSSGLALLSESLTELGFAQNELNFKCLGYAGVSSPSLQKVVRKKECPSRDLSNAGKVTCKTCVGTWLEDSIICTN